MNALWGLLLLACALAPGSEAIKCLCENIGCITGEGGQDEECPDELPKQYEDNIFEMYQRALAKVFDGYIDALEGPNRTYAKSGDGRVYSLGTLRSFQLSFFVKYMSKASVSSLLGFGSAETDGKREMEPQETINNQFCVKSAIGDTIIRGCGAIILAVGGMKMDEGCVIQTPRFGYCRCNEDLCNVGDVTHSSSVTISQGRAVYILSSLLVLNWSWLSSCPL